MGRHASAKANTATSPSRSPVRWLPCRQTASYRILAHQVDSPATVRAVGTACSSNPLLVVVRCHRVVHADDPMGGYRGGPETRRALLAMGRGVTGAVPALPGNAKYVLLGADCRPYLSTMPGQLGGHRRSKLYGRLDCPAALRAIAAGGYVRHRVFFADEATAVIAGYRPCAACLPDAYRKWKNA